MTKSDLIKKIELRTGHSELITKSSVDAICLFMSKALAKRERIEVRGFFSFEVRTKKSPNVRNPKTGGLTPRRSPFYVHGKQSYSWCKQMNNGFK